MEIKPRELEIKTITKGDYKGLKVVQLKPSVAFDQSFIEECRQAGVTEYVEEETKKEDWEK